jgi:uncharacterized protein (DUF488 family)
MNPPTVWTVGHSNHEFSHFLSILAPASIAIIADVRLIPGSRRHTQFQRENMQTALAAAGIGYRHFPDLGGRRKHRTPNSPNTAWRVESFNAYADHMQTKEFRDALSRLEQLAAAQPTAIMCAEALPWRCHRRLIADALVAKGWTVLDIFSPGRAKPHLLTEFAQIRGEQVVYPEPNKHLFDSNESAPPGAASG